MFTIESVREMTPVALENVYLESPARGLTPRYVTQQAINALIGWQNLTRNVNNKTLKPQVKEKIAKLLNVTKEEVVLTSSTSHGLNLLVNSMEWKGTENVVIPACEHPSNYYPWMHLRRKGVEVRVMPCCNGIAKADQLEKFVDSNTKIIAASLVSFYPGAYLEVEKYAEIAKKYNAYFIVDAIQAIGFRPVDPKKMGITALSAAAYKGLMSPNGCGFMYVDKAILPDLVPCEINMRNVEAVNAKPLYGDTDYDYINGADKLQTMHSHLAGLASLNGTLDILLEVGIDNIYNHINGLAKTLAEGLNSLGIKTALQADSPLLSHIVCADREDGNEIVKFARDQKVFFSSRREGIRLGLHLYNNAQDVERCLGVIKEYLSHKNNVN